MSLFFASRTHLHAPDRFKLPKFQEVASWCGFRERKVSIVRKAMKVLGGVGPSGRFETRAHSIGKMNPAFLLGRRGKLV